jgi:hypothetical protein
MRITPAAVLAAALGTLGCGADSPPQVLDYGGEDGKQIAVLVELLNEDSALPKLKGLFAPGSALTRADAARYGKCRYDLKGKPQVSDASATAQVVVIRAKDNEVLGEKDWEFVKDRDRWKIKSAPLP